MDPILLTTIEKLNNKNKIYDAYFESLKQLLTITKCKCGYFGEIIHINS